MAKVSLLRAIGLIAVRETKLLMRNRSAGFGLVLVGAVAWLPPLLVPLRKGVLGLGAFPEVSVFTLAALGVVVPLVTLLAGANLLSGELEDGSLVAVLTLPISRSACLLGKYLGLFLLFTMSYVLMFAGSYCAMAIVHGPQGSIGYGVIAASGLALSWSCLAIGAALGASGAGRVRAFGLSLVAWLLLVFVIDAVVLAVLVGGAPGGPASVGSHGHAELAPLHSLHSPSPPSGVHSHDTETELLKRPSSSPWWLILNPVDLFRISAVAAMALTTNDGESPVSVPIGLEGDGLWGILLTGWMFWLLAPLLAGLLRMRSLDLM